MLSPTTLCGRCHLFSLKYSAPRGAVGSPANALRRHRSTDSKRSSSSRLLLNDLIPFKESHHKSRTSFRPPYPSSNTRFPPKQHPVTQSLSPRGPPHPLTHTTPVVSEENVVSFFESHVSEWSLMPYVLHRLVSFGLRSRDCETLLDRFSDDVRAGSLSTPSDYRYYALERFCQPHDSTSIDTIYSTIFFSWASRDENQTRIKEKFRVGSDTLHHIQQLVKATSRPFPEDEYPTARKMHRKIIMHVGPTNSGKTHHALRALAAAKSGIYAGPLRLLAHEIWDRLNTGQIVPLGVDPPSLGSGTPARGNSKYARLCNMLTGEEHKIVDPDAKLLSCTVEMISLTKRMNVAVIDEVQMISDPDRGSGWVNAILGIAADEIHLCGEETAVPVVQALLQYTGDELVVRRYERLTPLAVEEKSLDGDLTKIREGDCIVTFSRSNIFALKKAVQEKTGMKCAVVYGRLPPEVRSEQAALFNDPTSGYNVIIGSDAIGMGLNLYVLYSLLYLKIFRIASTVKLSASSSRRPQSLVAEECNPFPFLLSSRLPEEQGVTVCMAHKGTWVALRLPCTLKTCHISSNVSRLRTLHCQ